MDRKRGRLRRSWKDEVHESMEKRSKSDEQEGMEILIEGRKAASVVNILNTNIYIYNLTNSWEQTVKITETQQETFFQRH